MAIDTNLLAWWEFDEGSGAVAGDKSGNFLHAGIFNCSWVNDATRGWSLSFNGTTSAVVSTFPAWDVAGFTVAAWVNMTTNPNHAKIVNVSIAGNGAWTSPYVTFEMKTNSVGDNKPVLNLQTNGDTSHGGGVTSTVTVSTGSWVHLVGTFVNNSGTATVTIYINGTSRGTATFSCGNLIKHTNAGDIVIGHRGDIYTANTAETTNGLIQGVRLYSVELSSTDVTDLYNYTRSGGPATLPTCVGKWVMAEGTGVTIADTSGYGNTGSLSGCSWTTDALLGNVLSFNGTSDYVSIPTNPQLDVLVGQFTLCALIHPAADISWNWNKIFDRPISHSAWSEPLSQLDLAASHAATGTPEAYFGAASRYTATSSIAIAKGTWWHLTMTYSHDNGIRIYINGVLYGTYAKNWTIGATRRKGTAAIIGRRGDYLNGANELFKGYIRNISLYLNEFSATDVWNQYVADVPLDTVSIAQLPVEVVYSVAESIIVNRPALFITT